ncbi:MAG: CRTAC1 family protein [Candidatus Poribacteria bacterium]|nr:CRTAC1 family protein [Candidatus Poribacteria bacterium]
MANPTINNMKIAFLLLLSLLIIPNGHGQPEVTFTDGTKESGITFQHEDGRSYKKYFVETLGSGVALFDYDNDNDVDIYLVNGTNLDSAEAAPDAMNRLYRNDGTEGFVDVTEASGVGHRGYGVGVCVGDYDNDGWLDMYVTNFSNNVLYRNNGDGTFTDHTAEAGVQSLDWSAGCAFADVDADGDLDLYVANYVNFSVETHTPCRVNGILVYCSPRVYDGVKDVFFRNNGDGTFSENTENAGFDNVAARGLGATFGDYDADGDTDLYVANDADANFLYNNDGKGQFREQSQFSGVALSEHGLVENGMGVAFGDYDNDTWLDLVVTNFQHQTNTLYHSAAGEFFTDQTYASGTGDISLPYLAWGVNFFDFDHDGFQDIFVANGHIHDNVTLIDGSTTYAQLNHLFWNNGNGTFTDVTAESGSGLALQHSSRGSAVGDIDNDGDLDIVVSNVGDRIDILRNDGGDGSGNWINLKLIGSVSNRAAIGTRVLLTAGTSHQVREVQSGSSYLSQNDLRLHFGVGTQETVELEIRWQNGTVQRFEDVRVNRFLKIVEGDNQIESY